MNDIRNYTIAFLFVLFLQLYLVDILSIRGLRPDFFIIFLLYVSIRNGSYHGVIVGFFVGIIADLFGRGSELGLSSIVYVTVGYLGGFLKKQHLRLEPIYFHLSWILIMLLGSFIYIYVKDYFLTNNDLSLLWGRWIFSSAYTLGFMLILQLLIPIRNNK
jgi:rod shape-determining protein MreD